MRHTWIYLAAVVMALVASAHPSEARSRRPVAAIYPWCANVVFEPTAECQYATFEQCQARISGLGGNCQYNPALAFEGSVPASRRWR